METTVSGNNTFTISGRMGAIYGVSSPEQFSRGFRVQTHGDTVSDFIIDQFTIERLGEQPAAPAPTPQPTPTPPITLTPAAPGTANVTINGIPVNFPGGQGPAIEGGRTLVPVRGVFEMLGFNVDWEAATSTAILSNDTITMRITIGNDVFTVNGTPHTLDVPAQNIGGRTMVPIRLPLESVGYNIGWDAATSTVLITSG
jgi:uncharacterized Zn-binding protein involved in type VI secretion